MGTTNLRVLLFRLFAGRKARWGTEKKPGAKTSILKAGRTPFELRRLPHHTGVFYAPSSICRLGGYTFRGQKLTLAVDLYHSGFMQSQQEN
jgi:hypothetical protein